MALLIPNFSKMDFAQRARWSYLYRDILRKYFRSHEFQQLFINYGSPKCKPVGNQIIISTPFGKRSYPKDLLFYFVRSSKSTILTAKSKVLKMQRGEITKSNTYERKIQWYKIPIDQRGHWEREIHIVGNFLTAAYEGHKDAMRFFIDFFLRLDTNKYKYEDVIRWFFLEKAYWNADKPLQYIRDSIWRRKKRSDPNELLLTERKFKKISFHSLETFRNLSEEIEEQTVFLMKPIEELYSLISPDFKELCEYRIEHGCLTWTKAAKGLGWDKTKLASVMKEKQRLPEKLPQKLLP